MDASILVVAATGISKLPRIISNSKSRLISLYIRRWTNAADKRSKQHHIRATLLNILSTFTPFVSI
jgi:hypothetical protein